MSRKKRPSKHVASLVHHEPTTGEPVPNQPTTVPDPYEEIILVRREQATNQPISKEGE